MAGIGLQQNINLSQTLSPQMQQSLHFLQAPVLELRSLVQQELLTNPILEENAPEPEENDEDWDTEIKELQEHDEDWRDYFSQNNQRTAPSSELQKKRQFLFDSQIEQETLSDHMIGQLILSNISEEELKIGEEIIGNLNEEGFFTATLEDIAQSTGSSLELAEKVLSFIQNFHPSGIAARDLRETLLIQLSHKGRKGSLEAQIVDEALDLLGRKRYLELSRKFKVSLERIQEAADYIGQLQPKPGSLFSSDETQSVVQAEAAFINIDGEWRVQLNNEPVPRLRISNVYKDLLGQGKSDRNLHDYLKERIRAGKFLIKCLHQRQDTIEKILNEIAIRQIDFLEQGVSHLKPLTMNQVADKVGVHETTVSRAVANKYIETPWGVFPIKYFFTSGYKTQEGETLANTSIKDAISDLIAREDSSKPLSDSEIVKILKERGIKLARRTVAKYRSELNILPSNLRKQI